MCYEDLHETINVTNGMFRMNGTTSVLKSVLRYKFEINYSQLIQYDQQFRMSVQVNTMLYCISVMLKVSVYSLYRYYKNMYTTKSPYKKAYYLSK